MTAFADEARELSPLEMAQNAAAAVKRAADLQATDPIQAHIGHVGEQGHQAAALAQAMALVSIAEDVRRIANHLDASRFRS